MAPCGRNVGIPEVAENIWLVSFMQHELGFFVHEAERIDCAPNPFDGNLSIRAAGYGPQAVVYLDHVVFRQADAWTRQKRLGALSSA
jgi:hypothetical protein